MYYGTKMPDFGNIWRDLQRDSFGNDVLRVVDDDVELEFWKRYIHDKAYGGTDQYSTTVWTEVEKIIGDRYYGSIMEIGPGWGNYTLELANRCNQMTCVDMSSDVLGFIKKLTTAHGFKVRTVAKKLEDYQGKGADLVFAFNCFYRMRDIEWSLKRIDQLGDDLHIIGMTSGPEQEYLKDFEKKLGLEIKYKRLDYILLVNILYQMDVDCNVRIVKLERDYLYESVEKAALKASRRIMSGEYDIDELMQIMKPYLQKRDDGMYHYVHKFKAALIYW